MPLRFESIAHHLDEVDVASGEWCVAIDVAILGKGIIEELLRSGVRVVVRSRLVSDELDDGAGVVEPRGHGEKGGGRR